MAEYTPKKLKGKTKPVATVGINFNTPVADTKVPSNSVFNWGNFDNPNMYGSSIAPNTGYTAQPFNIGASPMDYTNGRFSGLVNPNTGSLNLQTSLSNTDFGGFSTPGFSGNDIPSKPFSFADWGSKNKDLINGGVGIANSLANAYFGWKNLGLAKDQFKFQQDSWNKNFANQVTTTNNQLEEKARQRYNASPTTNISPEEYMAKHGVK